MMQAVQPVVTAPVVPAPVAANPAIGRAPVAATVAPAVVNDPAASTDSAFDPAADPLDALPAVRMAMEQAATFPPAVRRSRKRHAGTDAGRR
jgi:flagellar hook-length control protein FliK